MEESKYDDILSNHAPTCVPLACGNPSFDTCGNETCLASSGLGDGVDLSATATNAPLMSGDQQVIACAQGYRAQPLLAQSLGPGCDAGETYSRECGWCSFEEQFQCELIVCNATSTNLHLNQAGLSSFALRGKHAHDLQSRLPSGFDFRYSR